MISLKKFCEKALEKPTMSLESLEASRKKEAALFHHVVYEVDTAEQLQGISLNQLVSLVENFSFHMGETPTYVSYREKLITEVGKLPSIRRKRLI